MCVCVCVCSQSLSRVQLFAISDSKEYACNVGDLALVPGSGRSPGEGNGNPLQCSLMENPHGQRSLESYSPWSPKSWMCLTFRASHVTLVVKNPPANSGDIKRCEFDSWVEKMPWRREWQPTPVYLHGESYGQRNSVGYSLHRVEKSHTQLK